MLTQFNFELFFKALGLAFVLEGVLWAGFPRWMREAMCKIRTQDDRVLQLAGLVCFFMGLCIIWLSS